MAKDNESLDVPLKGVEELQRLLMDAHHEGSGGYVGKHEAPDNYVGKHEAQEVDHERAKKDARNAKARARRAAKKAEITANIDSKAGKSASSINGSSNSIGAPDILNRVAGIPSSALLNENSNVNMSSATDSGPQPGIGAIGQAVPANAMLQNLSNSRRDYNTAANRKNPFVADAASVAKSVGDANKQASQSNPQQMPSLPNGNMGSSGGSTSSGGGGTRPWWMKMQDTLDDIRDDIKRILDAIGHQKPGSSDARAKNDSQNSDSGGSLAAALTPLMMMIGAALVAKFGPLAAQVLGKVSGAVESGIKSVESFVSGVANDGKKVLDGVQNLEQKAMNAGKGVVNNVEHTVESGAEAGKGLLDRIVGGAKNVGEGAKNLAEKGTNAAGELADKAGGLLRNVASKGIGLMGKVVASPFKAAAAGASFFGLAEAVGHGGHAVANAMTGNYAGAAGESMQALGTAVMFGGPDKLVEHVPFVGKGLAKVLGKPGSAMVDKLAKFAGREAVGSGIGGVVGTAIGGPLGTVVGAAAGAGIEYSAGYAIDKAGQFVSSFGSRGAKKESPLDLLHEAKDKNVEQGRKSGRETAGVLAGIGAGAAIGAAAGSVVPVLGTAVGGLIGGAVGGVSSIMAENAWKKAHPDTVLNQVNQTAAAKPAQQTQSVAKAASATAATMPKPNVNSNVTTNNTTNINIARADVTSADNAKKLIGDALKKQAVADASRKKAQEAYSNPGMGNFFNGIGNAITSTLAGL